MKEYPTLTMMAPEVKGTLKSVQLKRSVTEGNWQEGGVKGTEVW